jgi:hypothetical protein
MPRCILPAAVPGILPVLIVLGRAQRAPTARL